jgi:glycosyltransferase involved in cell wall biosynthesis
MRFTIVVPTYNRAELLAAALTRLVQACEALRDRSDIVVVDNNSTDGTRGVVAGFAGRVRYLFEGRQGLSHARNAGIASVPPHLRTADRVIAFTDDDVEVERDWLSVIERELTGNPDADCVGGRVLPRWTSLPPPAWLSPIHWAPLALQDHGGKRQVFNSNRPLCLVGANVAFRANVFDRIGMFSPALQRVRDSIGSTEDHELLVRLYAAGGLALYAPDLIVWSNIAPDRLTRQYHRRWHQGHGRFHARMRLPEMERSRAKVLDVPVHLLRAAVLDAAGWISLTLARDASGAFAHETRLWFFSGFCRERCAWLHR